MTKIHEKKADQDIKHCHCLACCERQNTGKTRAEETEQTSTLSLINQLHRKHGKKKDEK